MKYEYSVQDVVCQVWSVAMAMLPMREQGTKLDRLLDDKIYLDVLCAYVWR
jgi:hypothetical protein